VQLSARTLLAAHLGLGGAVCEGGRDAGLHLQAVVAVSRLAPTGHWKQQRSQHRKQGLARHAADRPRQPWRLHSSGLLAGWRCKRGSGLRAMVPSSQAYRWRHDRAGCAYQQRC
jgi:hypothetical protein